MIKQEVKNQTELANLPLLPLKDIVIFPHMIIPVFIHEKPCLQAVEDSLAANRKIFVSAFGVGTEKVSLQSPYDVYDVGVVCSIMRTRKLPDGRLKVLVQGLARGRILGLNQLVNSPNVKVELIEDIPTEADLYHKDEVEALVRSVREHLEKLIGLGKVFSPDVLMLLEEVKEPSKLTDLVAANMGLKVEQAQDILDGSSSLERLKRVHNLLIREIEVCQMQMRIQSQAKEEIGKMQRDHYLREQIKVLRRELGDSDSKDDEVDLFRQQIEVVPLPKEAREEVIRNIKRLEKAHQDSSEATLARSYLETIFALPWGEAQNPVTDLKKVKTIMNEDHFGLEQVKERILEFLAVKRLNPSAKSPILCFVGPPGVGKTSLGRSIAKATGREFARIALGGVRDEAEIRGHRKTYVGAYPGRIIQALRKTKVANPVMMLDEIDKMGMDQRGDPASALLEVLDPEQNHNFVDHFLSVPFDLSQVMFIANANSLEAIPTALRDRMEIIEVCGYSEDEKTQIAEKFLIPKTLSESGLLSAKINITRNAVQSLIRGYTRESGLRGLEKQIASICRKLAVDLAERDHLPTQEFAVQVNTLQLGKFLGVKKYEDHGFDKDSAVGVSIAMAYTQYGGEILVIETSLLQGKEQLVLTGQLGEVMRESAHAALGYIRSRQSEFGLTPDSFKDQEIHVHLPQGGVPKDGPSAGIALVSSMLSALMKKPLARGFTMTGEITLHGNVLPIGGLREKILAAQREGLKEVILPAKNRSQFEALPVHAKKGISVHFVETYQDVFKLIFAPRLELLRTEGVIPYTKLPDMKL